MNLEDIDQTVLELRNFEKNLAKSFLEGKVKPPVHFSGGNEKELIDIFKEIKPQDWICTTYRNHYHALLRGIPKDYLEKEISEGRSMHINSKEYKFITSAIVSGMVPIALGISLALKKKNSKNRVWTFLGDMASETGIFHESLKYSQRNNLPITYIIEDNGVGVNTPTQEAWGQELSSGNTQVRKYSYSTIFPHQGCGNEVGF